MVLNTTDGPVAYDRSRPEHTINTSRCVAEDLVYLDEEPAILAVVSAGDWCAEIAGEAVPVLAFVVLDDASMYGVAVGEDGLVDLYNSVEKNKNFVRYSRGANINDKE